MAVGSSRSTRGPTPRCLRADLPGSDGWINDPQEFGEYTLDERQFDPATHLAAVDDAGQAFAGLVRVWV
jgi:hypothetical protein